jgi:hypothetical protein
VTREGRIIFTVPTRSNVSHVVVAVMALDAGEW